MLSIKLIHCGVEHNNAVEGAWCALRTRWLTCQGELHLWYTSCSDGVGAVIVNLNNNGSLLHCLLHCLPKIVSGCCRCVHIACKHTAAISLLLAAVHVQTNSDADNIIPDHVSLRGTLRALTHEHMMLMKQRIEEVVPAVVAAFR
jgi:hypothetical protein